MMSFLNRCIDIDNMDGLIIPYLISVTVVMKWFYSGVLMDIDNPCSFIAFPMENLTWNFHMVFFLVFVAYQLYISLEDPVTTQKKIGLVVCLASLAYDIYTEGLTSNGLTLFIFAKCTIDMEMYTRLQRVPSDTAVSSSPFWICVVAYAVNGSLCYALVTLSNFDEIPNMLTMASLCISGYVNKSYFIIMLITALSGYSEKELIIFNTAMHVLLTCGFKCLERYEYIEERDQLVQNYQQGPESDILPHQSNNCEPNVLQRVGKGIRNDPKVLLTTTRICIEREICLYCRTRHADVQMMPCTHISLCRDCAIEYGITILLHPNITSNSFLVTSVHYSNILTVLILPVTFIHFFLLNPITGDKLGYGAMVKCIKCRTEVDKVIEYVNEYDSRDSQLLSTDDEIEASIAT